MWSYLDWDLARKTNQLRQSRNLVGGMYLHQEMRPAAPPPWRLFPWVAGDRNSNTGRVSTANAHHQALERL